MTEVRIKVTTKGGRPPKPVGSRLSEVLNLRTTPDEYDSVCRAAITLGLTVTEYVRDKLGLRKTETDDWPN